MHHEEHSSSDEASYDTNSENAYGAFIHVALQDSFGKVRHLNCFRTIFASEAYVQARELALEIIERAHAPRKACLR